METDINFALQQLSPALDAVMHVLSFFGSEDFFLLLVPFIFWCVDSGFGARLLFLLVMRRSCLEQVRAWRCSDNRTASMRAGRGAGASPGWRWG